MVSFNDRLFVDFFCFCLKYRHKVEKKTKKTFGII